MCGGNETISLEFLGSHATHTLAQATSLSSGQSWNGRETSELVAEVGGENELTSQDKERWKSPISPSSTQATLLGVEGHEARSAHQ